MASITVSVGVKVAPWVERYIEMVKQRAIRTQQIPLLDIVERVIARGVQPYVAQ